MKYEKYKALFHKMIKSERNSKENRGHRDHMISENLEKECIELELHVEGIKKKLGLKKDNDMLEPISERREVERIFNNSDFIIFKGSLYLVDDVDLVDEMSLVRVCVYQVIDGSTPNYDFYDELHFETMQDVFDITFLRTLHFTWLKK